MSEVRPLPAILPDLTAYNPVTGQRIGTIDEYLAVFRSDKKHVGLTEIVWNRNKHVEVSTVHLIIDLSFGMEDEPVLWETMIFGDTADVPTNKDLEDFQARYRSEAAAATAHTIVVKTITRAVQDAGYPVITTDHPERCYRPELTQ